MSRTKNILILSLFFIASVLRAQTPSGYVLVKTNLSSFGQNKNSYSYQWTATNNTSENGNFFILVNIPTNEEIQSVTCFTSLSNSLQTSPPLPLTGSAPLTIGPFPIAADSSVTFGVAAGNHGQTITGETFSLLSQSQLSGNNSVEASSVTLSSEPGTPTPNGNLIQSVVAAPNISNGKEPIDFLVNLNSPALVTLTLFAITGEQVFDTQEQVQTGKSSLLWNVQNSVGQTVASGLYIYLLRVDGAGSEETLAGKVLILH
jgi:hypothetical protein